MDQLFITESPFRIDTSLLRSFGNTKVRTSLNHVDVII